MEGIAAAALIDCAAAYDANTAAHVLFQLHALGVPVLQTGYHQVMAALADDADIEQTLSVWHCMDVRLPSLLHCVAHAWDSKPGCASM
jgi:hypothetical protein